MRRLLLDTNIVLWLLLGDDSAIPDPIQTELEDNDNDVYVSAASVWELAIKRSLGRFTIEDDWVAALYGLDLDHMPVTAEHVAAVETLPWHHRDPFDRLLVAQAITENLVVVTADRTIPSYEVSVLW